ncbi:MAG TPA: biopolymer transporter ExbB [Oceanospirillales bacterium]|nr:biopolymer transporter ExbB [Oceanospirillaceae bacterium]MAR01566.1 biopolymer transporter ExbB [Oceanospirillaceae bacterium]HBS43084.1 biopolymer transporter ExbB [Oceanospirillales bacterium]|tara:strand:+ start:52504 stop:53022 length:519 start_codon:yes stop_codon:yes gene_type:complete
MNNIQTQLLDFMESGGPVLWVILGATCLLWYLIFERYWFFLREYPVQLKANLDRWQGRKHKSAWYSDRVQKMLISEIDCQMVKNLKVITGLIALLPMLGLLGTVTGMIQVFDVMAFMGSGNPRAMANGVSAATIPTMAGMVIALTAIPFATELERRYRREIHRTREVISSDQ